MWFLIQFVTLILWYIVPAMAVVPWGIILIPTWIILFLATLKAFSESIT